MATRTEERHFEITRGRRGELFENRGIKGESEAHWAVFFFSMDLSITGVKKFSYSYARCEGWIPCITKASRRNREDFPQVIFVFQSCDIIEKIGRRRTFNVSRSLSSYTLLTPNCFEI